MEQHFISLINQHRGILYKICNLYCDDDEDKKDLFQEIVIQLWRSFPAFRNDSKPSTWMYRVGLNTAISNFRKESRKPERFPLSDKELQIPDLEEMSLKNEQLGLLKKAIEKLNQIEKAIIMLYLDEKSYDEISDIIGITRTNVGVRINRIKSKLENIIKHTRS
ncbi:MAG TPA: RNA polymerase sigma factor [Pedobacter sp.]|jgi:RNA polymerase sigma-70 factor (ECF subfamily)